MRGFTDKYFEDVTRAVTEVEANTSAEIVVAVEPCSGNYRDVDLAVGSVVALAGLLGLFYSPAEHPEWAALLDALAFYALGAWVSSALPVVRRVLTRRRRREEQVRAAAGAAFYDEGVGTTRGRTGVLVYLSLLERQLVVLADQGVTTAVPAHAWNACVTALRHIGQAGDPAGALLSGLSDLGSVLAAALPPSADNPDELPNPVRHR
jgi:putative membrane protein